MELECLLGRRHSSREGEQSSKTLCDVMHTQKHADISQRGILFVDSGCTAFEYSQSVWMSFFLPYLWFHQNTHTDTHRHTQTHTDTHTDTMGKEANEMKIWAGDNSSKHVSALCGFLLNLRSVTFNGRNHWMSRYSLRHGGYKSAGLLLFYIVGTYIVMYGCVPTCDSVHTWWVYPLGDHNTSTMTWYPTQSYYPETEPTSQSLPYHTNVECLARNWEVSIFKSLVWLDQG